MWNMETDCRYMTLLHDSRAFLQRSLVFFILCLCKHGNENGSCRMIAFIKHVECLILRKEAQAKFPTGRGVVNELMTYFSKAIIW